MSWPIVKIGDVSEQIRGVSYAKEDVSLTPKDGYLPVLRANNITEAGLRFDDLVYVPTSRIKQKQIINKHDVVIAASSGSLDVVGKAASALVDFQGGFGAFCKVLRPNSKIDPRYFSNYFQTKKYRQIISLLAAGANINNLKNEHLDNLEIALPPLPEQRRIAAILDKAEAMRSKRREAIAKLDQLLQSVFLEMFGNPVENPKKWPKKRLEEIIKFHGGSQPPKDTFIYESKEGYVRLVQIRDFRTDKFLTYIPEKLAKRKFSESDIMIGRYGPPVFQIFRGLSGSYNVALMKAEPQINSNREYIFNLLKTDQIQNMVIDNSQRSAGQTGVNLKFLNEIEIGFPDFSLQEKFGKISAYIEGMKPLYSIALNESENLVASLQNQFFAQ